MWCCGDSQDVGLEAAIIERKRNSSLVKRHCAENPTGLSILPKLRIHRKMSGRGAFCGPVKVSREASWRGQKRLCRHK